MLSKTASPRRLFGGRRERGGRAGGPECDISDRQSVNSVMSEFVAYAGRLDVLVNNAVMFHYAPLVDMPEDVVQRMLAVGIAGTIWSLQAATPHLIASGGGSVINMSSVAVSFSIKNAAVYTLDQGCDRRLDSATGRRAGRLRNQGQRPRPGPGIDSRRQQRDRRARLEDARSQDAAGSTGHC